jgi:hypothetical protein
MSQSAESIVVNLLKNSTAITTIVGTSIFGGIPQDPAYPLIFLMRTDTETYPTLQAVSPFERAELSIYCEVKEMNDCIALAQQVKLLLNGYRDANTQGIFLKRQVTNPAGNLEPLMSSIELIFWVWANGYPS